MRILFIDYCNGHEYKNPIATIVEVSGKFTNEDLERAEKKQPGRLRVGGDWIKLLRELNVEYTITNTGKLDNLKKEIVDLRFKLTSGNY